MGGESGEDEHGGAVDIRDIVPALALPDPNDPTAHDPPPRRRPRRARAAAGSRRAAAGARTGGPVASDAHVALVLKTAYDGLEEKQRMEGEPLESCGPFVRNM